MSEPQVYVGQTRAREFIDLLGQMGIGECFTRGESYWPPRRTPWFYDNGAFGDWKSGRPFDVEAFERDLCRIREGSVSRPDFIVCPDIVAGGLASLAFSLEWRKRLRSLCPVQHVYLAVQDGMTPDDLPNELGVEFSGVFVGGTTDGPRPWKLVTAPLWQAWAHRRALKCHIGRVSSAERVRWVRLLGCDSFDSSCSLWSRPGLIAYLDQVFGPGPIKPWKKAEFKSSGRQGDLALGGA